VQLGFGTAKAVELVTFEDLERMPEEPGKTELLDGELIQMPPAKLRHNEFSENLFYRLRDLVDALKSGGAVRGIGKVHHEMGYKIGSKPDSWLVPDASVTHSGQASDDYYEGAPLIAIEVISESNDGGKDRSQDRGISGQRLPGSVGGLWGNAPGANLFRQW